jgi:phosphatidate cytidylyltransferase
MAFHWQTFKTRSLSALIFVAVMAVGLGWSDLAFFLLFSIIHFGCWQEYQKLIARIDPEYGQITHMHRYGVMIAGWSILLYFTCVDMKLVGIDLHAIGFWIGLIAVFVLPVIEILFARQHRLVNIGWSALGLLYISLSWGLMMDIRCGSATAVNEAGPNSLYKILPLAIIFSIWINDTMAYFVGSLIGRTPFSPISPKKTWEGTIGGAILAIAVMALLAHLFGYSVTQAVWVAAISAVVGTLGDLLESKIKRLADVKDSGQILPGHGGFLDRFDSLLLATPMVWIFFKLVHLF